MTNKPVLLRPTLLVFFDPSPRLIPHVVCWHDSSGRLPNIFDILVKLLTEWQHRPHHIEISTGEKPVYCIMTTSSQNQRNTGRSKFLSAVTSSKSAVWLVRPRLYTCRQLLWIGNGFQKDKKMNGSVKQASKIKTVSAMKWPFSYCDLWVTLCLKMNWISSCLYVFETRRNLISYQKQLLTFRTGAEPKFWTICTQFLQIHVVILLFDHTIFRFTLLGDFLY